jgi:glycosyltransferase involved in cell wall biosynthesis
MTTAVALPLASGAEPLRVVLFSTLYPNAASPGHGPFVEQRLCKLVEFGGVEARVLAPVPWFPFTAKLFRRYSHFAAAPRAEQRKGLEVLHPRYLAVPKIGMWLTPVLLALAALPTLLRWRREGWQFQLIDAHYYYPDGVAAALLARWTSVPLTITARGSDVNLIGGMFWPRRMMRWASRVAGASIGVSRALVDRLVAIGVEPASTRMLRNGVDVDRFFPVPQLEARERVGGPVSGLRLVCVAALVPVKCHALLLRALRDLPEWHLDLVGTGSLEESLARLAKELGIASRVRFIGRVQQEDLRFHYSAADLSVLASSSEGWPNVLLESMACGTAVVASRVGGIPEVVAAPSVGCLFESGSVASLATAIREMAALTRDPEHRALVRQYACGLGWDETSAGQLSLFAELVQGKTDA